MAALRLAGGGPWAYHLLLKGEGLGTNAPSKSTRRPGRLRELRRTNALQAAMGLDALAGLTVAHSAKLAYRVVREMFSFAAICALGMPCATSAFSSALPAASRDGLRPL